MSQLALTRRIAKLSEDSKVCKVETVLDYQSVMKSLFQAEAELKAWFSGQLEMLEEAERTIASKFNEANKR